MIMSFFRRTQSDVFRPKSSPESAGGHAGTGRLRRRELAQWIEKAAEKAQFSADEAENRGDHEIARIYRRRATLRSRTAQSMRERIVVAELLARS